MCNIINTSSIHTQTHTHTHTHTQIVGVAYKYNGLDDGAGLDLEWHRMTINRTTGPDCAVMCN